MKSSRSFDRTAETYDQTRPMLESFAASGIQAILDIVGPTARILDVGTGTGRISIPLLGRGADLVGSDLSAKMLRRLREKHLTARIAQADASNLPFPGDCFDAVLTVHVLHLVDPWLDALGEIRRVLKPGGVYLNIRTWEPVEVSLRDRIRDYWLNWIGERGFDGQHPGAKDHQEVISELQRMGAHVVEFEVTRYNITFTLETELERFRERVYSNTWAIPDEVYSESLQALRAWLIAEFGDLDQQYDELLRFVIDVAHFEN
jgi:ubiquinone/menaquinone biosynthesis C-methylase UbiE